PFSLLFLSFYLSIPHRHLHSFPTRRSSDLLPFLWFDAPSYFGQSLSPDPDDLQPNTDRTFLHIRFSLYLYYLSETIRRLIACPRSEEHTSELQSRFDLVCRLLLEKKKDIKT